MRVGFVGSLIATLLALVFCSAEVRAGEASAVFYLATRPGECLIASSSTGSLGHKTVSVVACTNRKHNFEVFAVRHGGWRSKPAPGNAATIVRGICRTAYVRISGHSLRSPGGTYGFWADPGAEQARYGDKVICSYILYPSYAALGAGRHIR